MAYTVSYQPTAQSFAPEDQSGKKNKSGKTYQPHLKCDLNLGAWNKTQNDEILHRSCLTTLDDFILHLIVLIANIFYLCLCFMLQLSQAITVH